MSIVNQYGEPYENYNDLSDSSGLYGNNEELTQIGMMSTGPNTEVYQSLASLRNTSRQFVSTNPIAKGTAQTFTSNLVGSGIVPRFQLKDSDLKKRLQDLFHQSASKMNFTEEKSSYYTDQYHVAHNVFASGEVCL
ncbi:MAG: phage portal protein [Lentisphaerae bacterium]|nr:phage portal protein [Lentisphaerota bacterium]